MKIIQIGRGPHNDINISNDNLVSRCHCTIIGYDDGSVKLIDRNSSNGTSINGQVIHGELILRPGDVVKVGQTIIPWQSYFPAISIGGGPTRIDFKSQPPSQTSGIQSESSKPHNSSSGIRPLSSKPNNYMVWSILSLIFCCLPFGIVSVVYASRVNSLWASGDYVGAERASRNAKTWFWWAFGIGCAFNIFWIIYYFIVGTALAIVN